MESKKGSGAAGRRSGGGGNPQLRSPAVKRPASAPVALQGWLHKQGSEGLMLWRRRWFVLAEYCLFYYKGPQEDKLLGSILLPSYKVSPCSADDKVYRKFSFKAEHANMRTYYFAADSRELMVQWMNALSLASILQDTGSWEEQRLGRPSVSSVSSQMNASADDSDSGFHGYRPSSNSPAPVPPPPLYANAPPKPRRVSPETISQQPQPQHHLEAPPVVYEPRLARPQEPYRPPPPLLHVNNERRTPDAYSRSNPKGADYEDVYTSTGDNAAVPAQFRSGGGSVAYIKGAGLPQQAAYLRDLVPPPAMYRTPQRPPPRPHSADFLDHDVRRSVPPPQQQPLYQPHSLPHPPRDRDRDHSRQHGARLARPKSSLDVAPAADYWSEEAYATKMRRQLAAQQRFLRSASARLPPRAAGTSNSGAAPTLEGERRSQQQREESMKRLLEWKQRMLQSPLTRKPAGSNNTVPTTRGGVLPGAHSDIYKQQVLRELEARRRATDGRRPSAPAAPISRYNSFSSDDEETDDVRKNRKRIRRPSQAGRSRASVSGKRSIPPDAPYSDAFQPAPASTPAPVPKPQEGPRPSEDRYASEKHSDSGYDTLQQAGRGPDQTEQFVYPVHEVSWKGARTKKREAKVSPSPGGEIRTHKAATSPPKNIVQTRIKAFEDENVQMQEPLKLSPPAYQPTEAHVSCLRIDDPVTSTARRRIGDLRAFALGDVDGENDRKAARSLLQEFDGETPEKRPPKQVDDAMDRLRQNRRRVFSDTETLLYDSGSEMTPAMLGSDDDEEVAAALGKREKFVSACRDLGENKVAPETPIEDLEVIVTPGYLRLSMAESMVTHEDSASSTDVTSTPLADGSFLAHIEEHYMPMTPSRKAVLAPPDTFSKSPTASQTIIMENILNGSGELEESSYVEMTEAGVVRCLLAPSESSLSKMGLRRLNSGDSTATYAVPDSPRYCEIGSVFRTDEVTSHYELLYRTYEPVYMEVSPLTLKSRQKTTSKDGDEENETKKNKDTDITSQGSEAEKSNTDDTQERRCLPDILSSSSPSATTQKQQQVDRDSSDADDEASKDLDSVDAPRHPRFSLSDTFRPASYYLGGACVGSTTASTAEHHDSSDSDLVSPPPIPTSPPPMLDEFEDSSLDLNKSSTTKDDSEAMRQLWDSAARRRPVSTDVISGLLEVSSDLESIGSRSGLAVQLDDGGTVDLDQYLEELQTRDSFNVSSYSKDLSYSSPYLNDSSQSGPEKVSPSVEAEVLYENVRSLNIAETDIGAPYYYSDLLKTEDDGFGSSTSDKSLASLRSNRGRLPLLNNQRDGLPDGLKRNDIGRKVNMISPSVTEPDPVEENRRLATELMKNGHVDSRNLYESDTLRRVRPSTGSVNLYPHGLRDKSRSLEGLLDESTSPAAPPPSEQTPSDHWEEDALWRESLRRVSLRHTRSLENLDASPSSRVVDASGASGRRRITRDVTYVNDCAARRQEYEEDYREGRRRPVRKRTSTRPGETDDGVHYERLSRQSESLERTRRGETYLESYVWDEDRETFRKNAVSPAPFLDVGPRPTSQPQTFEFDREKLRQWDLMSSAPLRPVAAGAGDRRLAGGSDQQPASGSGSVMGREPPRAVSAMSLQVSTTQPEPAKTPDQLADTSPAELGVSAGELLGRTHEELVLLLIQLRRTSAAVCKAMETCHMDIEEQARLAELDTPKRMEHLKKLEDLKKHLLDLEKQYEKGKPLVNLVDNMVKLGSLYRGPSARERVQFNQKVQEQRLLAEERRDWDRLSPDRTQLQAKVQQLYRLDRLLQEESSTLQSLQQDKELLERALGGLRHKLQSSNHFTPIEIEHYRKQQRSLERELSRVRLLLAHNSKKLEETVAENARLEQELVVLRQKLQRPITEPGIGTAALEAELRRVQRLVGDLTRQRKQLSLQVQQLTQQRPGPTGVAVVCSGAGPIPGRKRHHSTWLETDLDSLVTIDQAIDSPASPTYQTTSSGSTVHTPLYVNTETNSSRKDSGIYDAEDEAPPPLPAPPEIPPDYPPPPPPPPPPSEDVLLSPGQQYCAQVDISEADDRMKRFYGIIPREKQQEIKTVRIVKRESERRQRDRDRSGNIGIPLTNGIVSSGKRVTISESSDNIETSPEKTPLGRVEEEVPECVRPLSDPNLKQDDDDDPAVDAQFQRSMSLPRGFGKREKLVVAPPPPPVRSTSPRGDSVTNLRNLVISSRSHHERFDGSGDSSSSSPQLSPVFKSQAARAIVEEVSAQPSHKRPVPKEKRRHHTVSSSKPLLDLEANLTPMGCTRSRDDLDMERALRPRINTPDVVRSTMSHKDFKYNEDTIDSILGTPSKIIIPERYIPEQAPVLSAEEQLHRLKKAEAICKMLSETTAIGTSDGNEEEEQTATLKKKVAAEKKQREHLLQLNQLLARQVMEKSKVVAGSTSAAAQE